MSKGHVRQGHNTLKAGEYTTFEKQETRLKGTTKELACEAQGVELDWKNDREPLNSFQQGHDMKEEGKTRERRPFSSGGTQ